MIRLEQGDLEGALEDVARALAPPSPPSERLDDVHIFFGPPPTPLSPAMIARAHLVRARVHQIRGDHTAALAAAAAARESSDEPIVDEIAAASR